MGNQKTSRAAVALSIVVSGGIAGCSDPGTATLARESVGESGDSIVNGTALSASQVQSLGLAAIYHFDPPNNRWFPRPCSGKIISSVNGVSQVITARHCVTASGAISGTLLTPSQLRVSPTASPGLPNPDPPSSAITAASVAGAPVDSTIPETQRDQAIITVNANWSAQAAAKHALWVADPSFLVGLAVTGYGYGINVADWNCGTNISTVGAGVARSGGPFTIQSGARTKAFARYTTQNSAPGGQAVICGDSGGPDMLSLFGGSRIYYAGTHSTGTASTASSPIPSFWLQRQLGGGYMSAYSSTGLNVGVENGQNALVAMSAGDLRTRGFAYNLDFKQLRYVVSSAICVAFGVRSTDQSIGAITESCGTGGSNETWEITADQRLISIGADRQCLTLSSNNRLDLRPCLDARDGNVSRQRWLFHPQP